MNSEISLFVEPLSLNNEQLSAVKDILESEMMKGLSKSTNAQADLKMIPTFVTKLPNGNECGKFIALDLGGTNFRVVLATIDGQQCKLDVEKFKIKDDLMFAPGYQLFKYIAQCLGDFLNKRDLTETIDLGFTFSFPCTQDDLKTARLIKWTKGFNCDGVVGENVAKLLQGALIRKELTNVNVVSIANDTTGTLVSGAFKNKNCSIGLIVGTGVNACYKEKIAKIETLDDKSSFAEDGSMIINTELGAFGTNGSLDFIMTKYDKKLDAESLHPGSQTFEKMVSGYYLGEYVRLILLDICNQGLVFNGNIPESIKEANSFLAEYTSACETDLDDSYVETRKVLVQKLLIDPSDGDCEIVKGVCKAVSQRAAHLTAAAISCLLKKIDQEDIAVGYDGSVIHYHPTFRQLLEEKIKELNPKQKFQLLHAEDGSGRGSALIVAALKSKQ